MRGSVLALAHRSAPTPALVVAAVLAVALTVAGCGGGAGSSAATGSQPVPHQSSLPGSSSGTDDAGSASGSGGAGGSSVGPGFGGSAPVDGGNGADGSRTVDCGDVIDEIPAPPGEFSTVAKDVALPTRVQIQAARDTNIPTSDPQAYFAKYGLLVRVGVAVDLALAPTFANEAAIGWGRGEPGLVVHVPACSTRQDGAVWLVFAGGYYVNTPRCLAVEVRTPSGTGSADIGAGAPCPGQSTVPPGS
ncbi:hypothetical protein [Pseudofrankia sp. EUN1h]|uniref:hypothetical protein n=1 Tax=Pseudofrankia sp. EUN1h TaxID=1834515 RepID=UPI000234BEBF|nr:hypothetical protein [Pseudofrankia sp. EUN1h]